MGSDELADPQPKKWSRDEEARFLDHIDALVKANLWAAIKNDEELRKRGANGVRSHWDAMVSARCTSQA